MARKKKADGEEVTVTITTPSGKTITTDMEQLENAAEEIIPSEEFHEEPQRVSGNIKILKAKITKHDALEVEYRETYSDGGHSDVAKKCDSIVHPDLKTAFRKLEAHLVVICEQEDMRIAKQSLDKGMDFLSSSYGVSGFTIGGEGDSEGITLIGRKEVEQGTLNLITPFVRWESNYRFHSELGEAIELSIYEVKEYLKGKCAGTQPEIPFEQE